MKLTQSQTEKLLRSNLSFSQIGFSMLLARLKGRYAKHPEELPKCMDEINAFLLKFENIMTKDRDTIANL